MEGRGRICVSIAAEDGAGVLAAVTPVAELIDVIEIRLDGMRDPRLEPWLAKMPKPVLATNRAAWEGGHFSGSEAERIALLLAAARAGARYVDLELRTAPEWWALLLAGAKAQGTQVIASYHDFTATPPLNELWAILAQMKESGADLGKIVTTARTPEEALRPLSLLHEAKALDFPLSAFAMGAAGKISRLATLYLGGCMTYAALSADQATAPGQLTVHDLHHLTSYFEVAP